MAERMRPREIAAPLKDVTPLIEPEPSADAKTGSVTKSVTKPVASVTKSPTATTPVAKKRGRPAANGKAMTPAEKPRAFRERRKAKD